MGADSVINSLKDDPVQAIMDATKGVGVDVVLEMAVVPPPVYKQMVKVVRPGGRIARGGLSCQTAYRNLLRRHRRMRSHLQGITGRHGIHGS